jgi:hypothetical protein
LNGAFHVQEIAEGLSVKELTQKTGAELVFCGSRAYHE